MPPSAMALQPIWNQLLPTLPSFYTRVML